MIGQLQRKQDLIFGCILSFFIIGAGITMWIILLLSLHYQYFQSSNPEQSLNVIILFWMFVFGVLLIYFGCLVAIETKQEWNNTKQEKP